MADNTISKINEQLDAFDKTSASTVERVNNEVQSLKDQSKVLNHLQSKSTTTVDGLNVNKLGVAAVDGAVAGVKNAVGSLSGTIDVPIPGDSDAAPHATETVNLETTVADLVGTDKVKESTSKFVTLGGASFAAINSAITGAVDTVTTASFDGIKPVMEATGATKDVASSVVDDVTKEAGKGKNALAGKLGKISNEQELVKSITTSNPVETAKGLIQDVNESVNRTATKAINALGDGLSFANDKLSDIIKSTLGDAKDFADSIKKMVETNNDFTKDSKDILKDIKSYDNTNDYRDQYEVKARAKGISETEIAKVTKKIERAEEVLYAVDTSVTGTAKPTSSDFFNGTKTLSKLDNNFEVVGSVEELVAEFRTLKRDVTELVIHSSDTYTNQNIGAREINTYHKEEGFDGIQFHYVIRRNGVIERGVPINDKSEASRVNGHEEYAIDICLVGGINAPTGTPNVDNYFSDASYTRAQMESLETFIWSWYNRFPGGVVLGYGDIDNQSEQPYFSVMEYVEDRFDKPRVFQDPSSESPASPADLVKKRPV